MKLNTDISLLVKGKKQVYPTKRSMNLYFKEDRTTAPATAGLYILFAIVVLLAAAKFAIYDPWSTATQMKEQAAALEAQNTAALAQLADYNTVREDYVRTISTEDEQTQVDCMEILDLIDQVVRPSTDVQQVSISGNKVLLTFSGVTLDQSADLVTQLRQSPLVTTISVDTAASTEAQQNGVEVHVYFEVGQEEETQP